MESPVKSMSRAILFVFKASAKAWHLLDSGGEEFCSFKCGDRTVLLAWRDIWNTARILMSNLQCRTSIKLIRHQTVRLQTDWCFKRFSAWNLLVPHPALACQNNHQGQPEILATKKHETDQNNNINVDMLLTQKTKWRLSKLQQFPETSCTKKAFATEKRPGLGSCRQANGCAGVICLQGFLQRFAEHQEINASWLWHSIIYIYNFG